MPIGIQIGSPAEAGWNDPVGMLTDCHRRVEHFLGILVRLSLDPAASVLTPEQASALTAALHYFHTSGQTHSADEEQSLFPRLEAHLEAADPLLAQTHRLTAEHRQAERLHAAVEQGLELRRQRALTPGEQQSLEDAARRLEALYREHIRIEEQQVFAAARNLLTAAELTEIANELKARRGL